MGVRFRKPEWSKGALELLRERLESAQFRSRVLKQRVHLMERKDFLEFGPFRMDVRRRILTRGGEPVSLPSKALDVLLALLARPGETLSKDELLKEVWPDTFVEEGNLTQMVFLLRKALGESDGGQPLIVTVPRQGYRFVGELTDRALEETANGASTDPAAGSDRGKARIKELVVDRCGNHHGVGAQRMGDRPLPFPRTDHVPRGPVHDRASGQHKLSCG